MCIRDSHWTLEEKTQPKPGALEHRINIIDTPGHVDFTEMCIRDRDTVILIVGSLLVYICAISKKGLSKLEGFMFLLFYAVFFVYILKR